MTDTHARTHTPEGASVLAQLPEQAALSCGRDGRILRCNRSLAAMYGAAPEQLVGLSLDELLHTDDSGALWLHTAGGATAPVRAARWPSQDADSVYVLLYDRSDATAAEHAGELARRRYAGVLRIAGLAAFRYDRSSNTTHWLAEGAPLLGIVPGMLSTGLEALLHLVHPADRGLADRAWNEHVRSGARLDLVVRCLTPDGGTCHVRCVAERDETGGSTGYVADVGGNVGGEALRRSRQALDEAQEAADVGHWRVDLRTGAVSNSGRVAGLLAPTEMDTEHMLDGIHAEDRPEAAETVRAMLAGELTGPVRMPLRSSDGGHHLLVVGNTELDDAGQVVGLSGTMQDITRLRHLEQTVAEQRMKIYGAGKDAGVGTWEREPHRSILRVSAGLCELFGIEPTGEITEEQLRELVHPGDRERIAALLSGREATPAEFEFRVVPDNGTCRIVRCYAHVDARGPGGRLFGTLHDVTRLRELERLANEERGRSDTLADTGRWTWEVGSTHLRVSGGLFAQFGLPAGEATLEALLAMVHPEDVARVRAAVRGAGSQQVPEVEFRACLEDGTVRVLRANTSAVDDDGPLRLVGTVRDVTRLRELEQQVTEDRARWLDAGRYADIGSWEWDTGTDRLTVSGVLRELLGHGEVRTVAVDVLLDRVHPDDRSWLARGVGLVNHPDTPLRGDLELRVVSVDGSVHVLETHYESVHRLDGRRVLFGTTRDVTEQRALQRRLADRELLLGADGMAGVGTWSWVLGSDRVDASRTLRELWGFGADEVITTEALIGAVHEQDRPRMRDAFDRSARTGAPAYDRFEFRFVREGHANLVRTYLTYAEGDGAARLIGVAYEVNAVTAAHGEAADTREQTRGAHELHHGGAGRVVDLGTWEWTPPSEYIEFSSEFRRIYFPEAAGAVRLADVFDVLHPQDRQRIADCMAAATDPGAGVVTDMEFRATTPDGLSRVLRLHAEVLLGSDGVRRFAGTTYDITEQRVLERQLAEHEALLSGSGRATGIAAWEWDTSGELIEMSDALRELFGFGAGDGPVTGAMVFAVLHPNDREPVVSRLRALRGAEGPQREELEFRVQRPDGQVRTLRVYAEVAGHSAAKHRRLIGTVHDVSRLRELERKVAHDRVQLAEARKTARIGGWAWRIGSTELEIGPEAYDVLGLDAAGGVAFEEVAARLHAADAQRLRDAIAAVLAEDRRAETELRYRDGDGSYRVLRAYAERVADEHGEQWVVGNVHDLTRLRELERTVQDGETHLAGLGKLLEVGSWSLDPATDVVELSPWTRELWAIPADETVRVEQLLEQVYPEDTEPVREWLRAARHERRGGELELRFIDRRGNHRKVHVFAEVRTGAAGAAEVRGTTYDLTDQWLAETKVERSVQRYADLVAASPLGIALVDDGARVADVNQALCELIGADRESLLGAPVEQLAEFDAAGPSMEFAEFVRFAEQAAERPRRQALRRRDGMQVCCRLRTAESVQDDGRTFWILMYSDAGGELTDSRPREIDELTGLLNRAGVQVELRELLERGPISASSAAVLFCDVDNFARINDSLGHDFGDRVLVALAERLRDELPEGCVAARHSGDEFVVLCSDVRAVGGLDTLAGRIRGMLAHAVRVGDQQVHVSVSVGAAVPGTGLDSDVDLLRFADAAMFESKRKGGGAFSVAGAALIESMSSKMALESQLRAELAGTAGRRSGLTLHFQPVVNGEGIPVGAEALVRWNHPERGLLAPDKFLAVAAEADLLRALDAWVLRRALREAAGWACAGPALRVAVNLSALLPGTPEFDRTVRAAIEETGIDPARVVLELVETSLVTMPSEGVAAMRALVGDGVQFAVDDFGTGYSSLARLKDLPVQIIKVDRKFVAGAGEDPSDTAVVRAVVDMAKAMGRTCIAEGVERTDQFDTLRAEGVDGYQGWLFSRPVPAAQFRARIG